MGPRIGALCAALAGCALALSGTAAAAAPPSITLQVSTSQVRSHQPVTLTGVLSGAPSGTTVTVLEYPYDRPVTVLAQLTPDASGAFTLTAHPDRISWYRAIAGPGVSSPMRRVDVSGRADIRVRALSLGRAGVTVLVYHPADLHWNGVLARWRFTSGGRTIPAQAVTRRLSRYVTQLQTAVTLPAGRFGWRVCFYAPDDRALANPGRPKTCAGRGYSGRGSLPNGFPYPSSVARAGAYLAARSGRTAFAVIDSEGRLSGVHMHWTFVSASVVKAMLLVTYLRRLHALGQHYIDATSNSFLYPMINVSDNSAATRTWSIVGQSAVYALAREAGMTDFSVYGFWANAQISAADQARFFFEMDSLIPPEFVGYARRMLSTIAAYESWGIPAVARPLGYSVFFKGGWRTTGLGQLVHQVARLEGHHRTAAIAVMTDGDPSMSYGIDTIEGVTRALVG
jgi:Beta-lactamase enzyme family